MIVVREHKKLEAGDCIQITGKKSGGTFSRWVTNGAIYKVNHLADGAAYVKDNDGDNNSAITSDYTWELVKMEKIFVPLTIQINNFNDLKEILSAFNGDRNTRILEVIAELKKVHKIYA